MHWIDDLQKAIDYMKAHMMQAMDYELYLEDQIPGVFCQVCLPVALKA